MVTATTYTDRIDIYFYEFNPNDDFSRYISRDMPHITVTRNSDTGLLVTAMQWAVGKHYCDSIQKLPLHQWVNIDSMQEALTEAKRLIDLDTERQNREARLKALKDMNETMREENET